MGQTLGHQKKLSILHDSPMSFHWISFSVHGGKLKRHSVLVQAPSIWGKPWLKESVKTLENQGKLFEADEDRARMSWWRAQATKYLLRWPSKYLCRLTNRERHLVYGKKVNLRLKPHRRNQTRSVDPVSDEQENQDQGALFCNISSRPSNAGREETNLFSQPIFVRYKLITRERILPAGCQAQDLIAAGKSREETKNILLTGSQESKTEARTAS
jgi:hypothetical protein